MKRFWNAVQPTIWISGWFGLGIIPAVLCGLGPMSATVAIAIPGAIGLVMAKAIWF